MRMVVLGARGLLGRDLCAAAGRAHDVLPLDLPDCDITQREAVREALRDHAPDSVVNCAAYTSVDGAESEPERAFAVNADGARNVALGCAQLGANLIHLSTDYVFAGDATEPYEAGAATAPASVYGRSKLAGEEAVREALTDALIVRSCGLYGLHGPSFVSAILTRALRGEPLKVVDDQTVGAPTYAVDLADAIIRLAEARAGGIRHFVNAGVCTWHEFARVVLECAGLGNYPIEPVTTEALGRPAPRPRYSALSPSEPRLRPYREALAEFVPRWLARH